MCRFLLTRYILCTAFTIQLIKILYLLATGGSFKTYRIPHSTSFNGTSKNDITSLDYTSKYELAYTFIGKVLNENQTVFGQALKLQKKIRIICLNNFKTRCTHSQISSYLVDININFTTNL